MVRPPHSCLYFWWHLILCQFFFLRRFHLRRNFPWAGPCWLMTPISRTARHTLWGILVPWELSVSSVPVSAILSTCKAEIPGEISDPRFWANCQLTVLRWVRRTQFEKSSCPCLVKRLSTPVFFCEIIHGRSLLIVVSP